MFRGFTSEIIPVATVPLFMNSMTHHDAYGEKVVRFKRTTSPEEGSAHSVVQTVPSQWREEGQCGNSK